MSSARTNPVVPQPGSGQASPTQQKPALPLTFNIVLSWPSDMLRMAFIKIAEMLTAESGYYTQGGLKPTMRCDTESALRAYFPPGECAQIWNVPSARMRKALGDHYAVVAIVYEGDRVTALERAAEILRADGFEGVRVHPSELEFPDNFLPFLTVEGCPILLMLWPDRAKVSPELAATFPKREPW